MSARVERSRKAIRSDDGAATLRLAHFGSSRGAWRRYWVASLGLEDSARVDQAHIAGACDGRALKEMVRRLRLAHTRLQPVQGGRSVATGGTRRGEGEP